MATSNVQFLRDPLAKAHDLTNLNFKSGDSGHAKICWKFSDHALIIAHIHGNDSKSERSEIS